MKKIFRRIIITFAILVLLGIIAVVCCNSYINRNAENRTYESVETIPYNEVGLLLGTSPDTRFGHVNSYFTNRVKAAAELYFAGKISFILVSGDNHRRGYNEPEELKKALMAAGVPESAIYLDYAGFRTLDSIIRAKKVFGQSSLTIISQKWHNERAIYLADNAEIEAIGYNANDVTYKSSYIKNHGRELVARVKAVMDVVFHKGPKFLGEEIQIGE